MAYEEQFEPRWRFVLLGDGHIAQERARREKMGDDGIEGWEFILIPSKEIRTMCGLKFGEDLDDLGRIRKWYPKTKVRVLSEDPVVGRVLVTTNFEGEETGLSRWNIEKDIIIENQQKQIKTLKEACAGLQEDLKHALTQRAAYARQVAELIQEYKKATSYDTGMGFPPGMPPPEM